MPEMGQSGSEGGVALIPPSLPLSLLFGVVGFKTSFFGQGALRFDHADPKII